MSRAQKSLRLAAAVAAVLLLLSTATVFAEEPSDERALFDSLLKALEERSRKDFLRNANANFASAITRQAFNQMADFFAPRLQTGFEIEYLGSLDKPGAKVHLWKIVYEDGGDDTLAKLVKRNGEIAGLGLE